MKKRSICIYETDNGVEFLMNFENEKSFSKALRFLDSNGSTADSKENTDEKYFFLMSLAEFHDFKAHMNDD